jgi:hypothetical protein
VNRRPDTSGIDRHWKEGEDDRVLVGRLCGHSRRTVDSVLEALRRVIASSRRTKIVGFGVFEWKPWNNRLPTGMRVETWRLSFKPCRYREKYNGDR